jgi:hypothetical protein
VCVGYLFHVLIAPRSFRLTKFDYFSISPLFLFFWCHHMSGWVGWSHCPSRVCSLPSEGNLYRSYIYLSVCLSIVDGCIACVSMIRCTVWGYLPSSFLSVSLSLSGGSISSHPNRNRFPRGTACCTDLPTLRSKTPPHYSRSPTPPTPHPFWMADGVDDRFVHNTRQPYVYTNISNVHFFFLSPVYPDACNSLSVVT